MALLSTADLETLSQEQAEACVSLYMPMARADQTQQNPIRLKNLLKQAETQLVERGMRAPEAKALLEPAQGLLPLREFWERPADGLVAFVSPNMFRHFRLPTRLEERVVINSRFYVKPLLPFLTGNGQFYVLALSQGEVRLLRGTRDNIVEVPLDDPRVPKSLDQALKYDQLEEQTQVHSFPSGEPNAKFGQTAIFHGHGVGEEDAKTNIRRFFQQLEAGVRKRLGDGKAPLVLAGVEYLHPIYKQVNTYPNLLDEGILGNPSESSPETLHAQAWKIIEPGFQAPMHQQREEYEKFMGRHDQHASNDPEVIVPASFYGRVATLFVDKDAQVWGAFDPADGRIEVRSQRTPRDEDLVDLASIQTLRNNGMVYVLPREQMPDQSPLAAIFRY